MKSSFVLQNITSKLSFVSKVSSGRNDMPILTSILIEAVSGNIKISATDLETGVVITIPANTEEEGKVLVPARVFIELIGNISEEKVTLETEADKLNIKTDKIKTSIQTLPSDDFPKIYEEKGENWIKLEAKDVDDLRKIIIAASLEGDRPALSGILIKKEKTGKTFVATDGYRLSLETKKEAGEKEEEILVPAKLLRDQLAIKEAGLSILFSPKTNQIILEREGTLMVGRLIEASFPEYQKIVPQDSSTKASFEKRAMQQAIKTCSVFARETSNIIKFSIKKDSIVVSANAPTLGEGRVEVPADVKGEENEIAFNARYLTDILGAVSEDEMTFEMTTPVAPGVFRIVGNDSFLHLIMPIRVQE